LFQRLEGFVYECGRQLELFHIIKCDLDDCARQLNNRQF
jgi:hypothetical protein